jgi:hypothetical protein
MCDLLLAKLSARSQDVYIGHIDRAQEEVVRCTPALRTCAFSLEAGKYV